MATVAVGHRLLRIMVAMLKSGREFNIEKLNVERKVEVMTRARYYRIKNESVVTARN